MDIVKKLNDMRLRRNMSVYRLAEMSGLNQSTLANTFSRGIVPSIENLGAMCEAMGVTLAQFFCDEEETDLLTPQEKKLIEAYRQLTPEVRQAIVDLASACSDLRP